MKQPRDVAFDMWVSTRTAHPHEVKTFAEVVSTDPSFVKAVILEYSKLQTNAGEFGAAEERNMPE